MDRENQFSIMINYWMWPKVNFMNLIIENFFFLKNIKKALSQIKIIRRLKLIQALFCKLPKKRRGKIQFYKKMKIINK